MPLSQPGIFNVLDYQIYPGSYGNPRDNTANLQALIYLVQSLGGGTILFPSQYEVEGINYTAYEFNGTIGIGPPTSPSPVSIIFAGTAQGTAAEPTLVMQANGDLFEVDTGSPEDDGPPPGDQHVGGITFQDLSIMYENNVSSGTAINVISGENVRIIRVVFLECPQAVAFADTLQCSIFECTATYNDNKPYPACISLGIAENGINSKETYIASCTLLSSTGGIGLIIQGAEHVRMMNVRIEGFLEGINITPGTPSGLGQNSLKHHFGNVTVFTSNPTGGPAGSAVTIEPLGSQNISEIVFANCTFEPDATVSSTIGPGVYISQGPFGATITDIRFVSCRSTRWTGPGIEIAGGSNIEVTGGLYSGNASGANPSGGSGGISITGPATAIRIIGAACIGSYPYIQNHGAPTPSPVQDVGIYIAGDGPYNIIIDHCDLTGNSQYAVSVNGIIEASATEVFIRNCNMQNYTGGPIEFGEYLSLIAVTNCSGYNDLATPVSTRAPANNAVFSASTYGYYGPVFFTVEGGGITQIAIDGQNTNLTSGGFHLSPRDTAKITYSNPVAPTFVMIGQ